MVVREIKECIANNGKMVNRNSIKNNVEMVYKRKQKPERVNWYRGDWGSKLLFKARTGTLEVKGRSREDQDQN